MPKTKRFGLQEHWLLAVATSYFLWAIVIFHVQGLPVFSPVIVKENLLWLAWLLSGLLLTGWQYKVLRALQREIKAINLHSDSLCDNAFNLSANSGVLSELIPIAEALTAMSRHLQLERAGLYQRELLLDTVLQSSPSALVLTDDIGRVLLTNPAARTLLNKGKRFDGSLFSCILDTFPEISTAISQQQSLVFFDEAASVWHLSTSHFTLNQRCHHLYQFKPVTKEIHQEEIKAWKKLLRVIGHELNNSLAPMSSLAYSGRKQSAQLGMSNIADMFATISERCQHLNQFLQDYITFAKLPAPQLQLVHWAQFINELQDHYEFELIGSLPQRQWLFDQAQLGQLLLNCLKNSREAGASEQGMHLSFIELSQCLVIELQDDAGGMSEEVLSHALVPFYTTKEQGSGIGLTLCQDIVQGHGGRLELTNRPPGLLIKIFLPSAQS